MRDVDPFSSRLLPAERVLWNGRPAGGIILGPRDAFLIPFSIFWCGFVVFWIYGVVQSGAGLFALFGVAMLMFGLFITVGRFALDAWLRAGTHYALTDRRVLIVRTRPSTDFTAIDLDRLPQARLTERSDGRGTIRFGQPINLFASGGAGLSVWAPSLDPLLSSSPSLTRATSSI